MYRYVAYRALWLALRRPLEASVGSTDGTQSQEYIRGLEEMREKIVICGCGQRKDYLDIYFTGGRNMCSVGAGCVLEGMYLY